MQVAVAQAYYQSGNNKDAVRVMNELLADRAERPRAEGTAAAADPCGLREGRRQRLRQPRSTKSWCVNYPKPEYWQNLMVALRSGDLDDIQRLNVMRLAVHVNVLKKPEEFKEMAQLALEEKLACEAQTVLEQGFAKKVFVEKRDVDVNTRLLDAAKKEARCDKAALPKNEAAAQSAATGDALVKVGAQYLGCGDAAKAVAGDSAWHHQGQPRPRAIRRKRERNDEAYLLLGIAHLRNNNKAEAAKAFRTVKRDPTMVRIAKLWLLNT